MSLFPRLSRKEGLERVQAALDNPASKDWDHSLAKAAEDAQQYLRIIQGQGSTAEPRKEAESASNSWWTGGGRSPRHAAAAASSHVPVEAGISRPGTSKHGKRGQFLSETHNFEAFGLRRSVIEPLLRLGFLRPTVVQEQAIPAVLSGANVVIHAETGSGKTLAFALPILNRVAQLRTDGCGPLALVLVPSQELCDQVCAVFRVLDPESNPISFHGGSAKPLHAAKLAAEGKWHHKILVATPTALEQTMRRSFKGASSLLSRVRVVGVDEADMLLSSLRVPTETCLWMAGQPDRQTRELRSAAEAEAVRLGRSQPSLVWNAAFESGMAPEASASGPAGDKAASPHRGGRSLRPPRLGRDSGCQFVFAAATLSDTTHRDVGEWFRRNMEAATVIKTAGAHMPVTRARLVTVVVDGEQAAVAAASAGSAGSARDDAVLAAGVERGLMAADGAAEVRAAAGAEEGRLAAVLKAVRGSNALTPHGITLVFVNSQTQAELTAAWLEERVSGLGGVLAGADGSAACSVRVAALHKGVPQALRADLAAELLSPPDARGEARSGEGAVRVGGTHHTVLVATDLAARGLDTTRVRHVINAEVPTDAATFLHRAGRTARAGASGTVTTIVMRSERERAVRLLRQAEAGEEDTVTARQAALQASRRRAKRTDGRTSSDGKGRGSPRRGPDRAGPRWDGERPGHHRGVRGERVL